MAFPDVSVTLNVQAQDGEDIPVDPTERLWLNGLLFGENVPVSLYQESSFLTEIDDSEPRSLMNVRYRDDSSALLSAAALYGSAIYGLSTYGISSAETTPAQIINLPVPTDRCQLRVRIVSNLPIMINSAKFYAYDGINDVIPYPDIEFRAVEGGVSTSWVEANGSSQALVCQDHSLALIHDYYLAVSASPKETGDKQGKVKFVFTYEQ